MGLLFIRNLKTADCGKNVSHSDLGWETLLYTRHAQHTARGPNVSLKSFQFGLQSQKLSLFCLIFNENIIKNGKNSFKLCNPDLDQDTSYNLNPALKSQYYFEILWWCFTFKLCNPDLDQGTSYILHPALNSLMMCYFQFVDLDQILYYSLSLGLYHTIMEFRTKGAIQKILDTLLFYTIIVIDPSPFSCGILWQCYKPPAGPPFFRLMGRFIFQENDIFILK